MDCDGRGSQRERRDEKHSGVVMERLKGGKSMHSLMSLCFVSAVGFINQVR